MRVVLGSHPPSATDLPLLPGSADGSARRLRLRDLIGFTVNHRFGLPGLKPPFVIAQVALEDDPRVHLTTNAIECEPDELVLGMRMEVVFHQDGDVWLPLFRPTAEQGEPAPLPVDEIEPEQIRFHIRPPATQDKFEDKVAITGIGASDLGRRLMVDPIELTVQACERAVADAGLTLDDIDGLSTYPGAARRRFRRGRYRCRRSRTRPTTDLVQRWPRNTRPQCR